MVLLYTLAVDWDNDGLFEGGNEDITQYAFEVEYRRGRDYASMLTGKSTAGTLTSRLNNNDGRFNSFNAASAIGNTNIVPGRKCRFNAGPIEAGQFTRANTEYLSIADNAALSTGDIDFTCTAMIKADSIGNVMTAIGKYESPVREWAIVFQTSDNRFHFGISSTGSDSQEISATTPTPAAGTWYFVAVWFDGATNTQYIQINDGTIYSAVVTPPVDRAGAFSIGSAGGTSTPWDGAIACVGFWKRVLTAAERTILYNGGFGTLYEQVSASIRTSLTSYWNLYEASGTRNDSHSTNHLTDNNTVTGAVGPGKVKWQGYLDRIEPQPSVVGHHKALLYAIGPLGFLNQKKVHTSGNTNQLTGAAIGAVLDAAAWPAAARSVDAGESTIIRWWEDEVTAFDALRDIEEQEIGYLLESGDGKVVFEDRNHRLSAPHTTSQATWSDTAGQAIRFSDIQQMDPLKEIYNIIEIPVQRFTVGALAELWTLSQSGADSPPVLPGETIAIWATYPSFDANASHVGVDAWTTPVITTDYTANSQANGLGSDLSASLGITVTKRATSMEIEIINNHATLTAYITFFQARGTPISESDEIIVKLKDDTSIARYGERTFLFPAPFHGLVADATTYGYYILSIYSKPIPVLRVKFSGSRAAAHLTEITNRDVSDRVTISAAGVADLGISEDFFVENERHMINVARHEYAEYELSPASGYVGFWVLGTSLLGQSTRLGW